MAASVAHPLHRPPPQRTVSFAGVSDVHGMGGNVGAPSHDVGAAGMSSEAAPYKSFRVGPQWRLYDKEWSGSKLRVREPNIIEWRPGELVSGKQYSSFQVASRGLDDAAGLRSDAPRYHDYRSSNWRVSVPVENKRPKEPNPIEWPSTLLAAERPAHKPPAPNEPAGLPSKCAPMESSRSIRWRYDLPERREHPAARAIAASLDANHPPARRALSHDIYSARALPVARALAPVRSTSAENAIGANSTFFPPGVRPVVSTDAGASHSYAVTSSQAQSERAFVAGLVHAAHAEPLAPMPPWERGGALGPVRRHASFGAHRASHHVASMRGW